MIFGKLPYHGDFIVKGMSASSRRAWDSWLSADLVAARHTHGAAFDTVHENAPPWCFLDGPGCFGKDWRTGALAPSIDSVGRRYFIVVGIDGLSAEQAVTWEADCPGAMEDLIYSALTQTWDADRLFHAAGDWARKRAPNLSVRTRPAHSWWRTRNTTTEASFSCAHPTELLSAVLAPGAEP